jgi:hypothetical protein
MLEAQIAILDNGGKCHRSFACRAQNLDTNYGPIPKRRYPPSVRPGHGLNHK